MEKLGILAVKSILLSLIQEEGVDYFDAEVEDWETQPTSPAHPGSFPSLTS